MLQSQTFTNNHRNHQSISSKTIGQIKREKLLNPDPKIGIIDRKYESGDNFHYEAPVSTGSYMTSLSSMENTSKELISNCNAHKEEIFQLRNQINGIKSYLNDSYQQIKKTIINDIDNIEMKTKVDFNKQKIINVQINNDMKYIHKEFTEQKDIVLHLKERLSKLQSSLSLQ